MNKKLVYCVDTDDNIKISVCVFTETNDKEKLADAIYQEAKTILYIDEYDDFEKLYESCRCLVYGSYSQFREYEFGIEDIKELEL